MRPTLAQQLAGVDRLLTLAEEAGRTEAEELISNARRVVKKIRGSLESGPDFFRSDSAQLAEILGEEPSVPPPTSDTATLIQHHERLVAALSAEIVAWDDDDSEPLRARREQVGNYLLRRAAANPT